MDKNQYLKQIMQDRDALLGIGGNYCFIVHINNVPCFRIPNLSKKRAKELFDLVDENNELSRTVTNVKIKFEITAKGEQIDENMLPNIFTNFFS